MEWLYYVLGVVLLLVLLYSALVTIAFGVLFRRPLPLPIGYLETFFGPNFGKYIDDINETKNYYKTAEHEYVEIISNNIKLRGKYYPKPNATKIIVFVHGYYSSGDKDIGFLGDLYIKMNVNLLIIDQRACGRSEGVYTSFGALEHYDIREWLFYLDKRFNSEKDVYLHGVSMGAATSLLTSSMSYLPPSFKGTIADCGYSRTNGVLLFSGKRLIRIKPRLLYFGLKTYSKLFAGFDLSEIKVSKALQKNYTVSILFIHGKKDRFVPANMSVKNYKASRGPKKLVIFEEAEHCESYYIDKELYTSQVKEFINEL